MHREWKTKRTLLCGVAGMMAVLAPGLLGQRDALAAQDATGHAATAEAQKMPARVTAAGGKAEFEVASVREGLSAKFRPPPFSMDADDGFTNTGGLFTADLSLQGFIDFAY